MKKHKQIAAMFCEHANEVPQTCRCPSNCYCKRHTCKQRAPSGPVAAAKRRWRKRANRDAALYARLSANEPGTHTKYLRCHEAEEAVVKAAMEWEICRFLSTNHPDLLATACKRLAKERAK